MRTLLLLAGSSMVAVTALTPVFSTFAAEDNCALPTGYEQWAGAKRDIQLCDATREAGVNNVSGEAKKYLYSIARNLRNSCAPVSDAANIVRLNNTFAVCSAAFLKAYKEKYGDVYVVSAFRDGAPGSAPDGSGRSANQCAGGATRSNHTRGVAMDVNPTDERMYPTLWKFASDNPQFGVCFPYQNHPMTGYPNGDRPHMALAGIGGREGALCAAQGVKQPCSAGMFTGTTVIPATTGPGTLPTRDPSGTLSCPTHSALIDDRCYVLPPSEEYDDVIPSCPQGYVQTGGGCIPFPFQQPFTMSPSMPGIPTSQPSSGGSSPGTPTGGSSPSTIPSSILSQLNSGSNLKLNPTTSTSPAQIVSDLLAPLQNTASTPGTATGGGANINSGITTGIVAIAPGTETTGVPSDPTNIGNGAIPPYPDTTFTPSTGATVGNGAAPQDPTFRARLASLLAGIRSGLSSLLGYLQGLAR